jgi:Ca2+-binding RTX toxin-like protein
MKMNNTAATVALLIVIVLAGTATAVPVSVWAANLIGTPGPDTLAGTNNDDNIIALGGNDKITDGFGSDKILAGSGDDTIKLVGTQDPRDSTDDPGGQDVVYGEKGRDNIDSNGEIGFRLIFGGDDDDTIHACCANYDGRIFGGSGNDQISAAGDVDFDVWGGSGNDRIDGSSECALDRIFGESGNDNIQFAATFTTGGPGNDIIHFNDCGSNEPGLPVAYGDSGDDEIVGGEFAIEAHGGSGDDTIKGADGEDDELFGDGGDDMLTGDGGADSFSCGAGIDTITDFNAAEGDTKTTDCENF